MHKKHLLIVDDDKRIRRLLKRFLVTHNYRISLASDSIKARNLINNIQFDLLIIDVMMPGEDGLALTKHISAENGTPILLLSAKVQTNEKILGFEMGADDYLGKPFEPRELVMRVEAILKRNKTSLSVEVPHFINIGNLKYDTRRGELWNGSIKVHLTTLEIELMQIFAKRANTIVQRSELDRKIVSGSKSKKNLDSPRRNIDVQIRRLRQKLESDPKSPRYLQTIRGYGYRLNPG